MKIIVICFSLHGGDFVLRDYNDRVLEKEVLITAIEKAIDGENVEYIICDDMLDFEEYDVLLLGNNYVIQEFGNFFVALIFR